MGLSMPSCGSSRARKAVPSDAPVAQEVRPPISGDGYPARGQMVRPLSPRRESRRGAGRGREAEKLDRAMAKLARDMAEKVADMQDQIAGVQAMCVRLAQMQSARDHMSSRAPRREIGTRDRKPRLTISFRGVGQGSNLVPANEGTPEPVSRWLRGPKANQRRRVKLWKPTPATPPHRLREVRRPWYRDGPRPSAPF